MCYRSPLVFRCLMSEIWVNFIRLNVSRKRSQESSCIIIIIIERAVLAVTNVSTNIGSIKELPDLLFAVFQFLAHIFDEIAHVLD